jgi:aspartate racemase
VTVFIALLAAFKTLLHCYTGQDDLVVGSPIAGRNLVETEELIGCFANTLVLRTDLSGDPSFRELLGRVRETAVNAYAHQDVPFEKLVEELQPRRDASYTPLFQVSFSLQTTSEVIRVPGLTMSRLPVDNGTVMFDLVCNMKETDEGLFATMEYSTDLFNADTVDRMLGGFEVLLDGIVSTPDASLSELEETVVRAEKKSVAAAEVGRKEILRLKLKHIERKKIPVN